MKKLLDRIFIDGLGGMAQGLFATLIIGTIIQQIGLFMGGGTGDLIYELGKIAAGLTGAGIGVGVARKLEAGHLVIVSAAVVGMIGAFAGKILSGQVLVDGNLVLAGPGEPLGAFAAAYLAIEIGILISGKTKLDIILTPLVCIGTGSAVGLFVGPPISEFMLWLQIPNIVRRPLIWLPVILSSAVLGPIGTMLLHMTNNATGSGMGTAGLVGPLMTWQVMTQSEAGVIVLGKIILIQFILPAAVTLLISEFMRKKKWIRQGDMKLEL